MILPWLYLGVKVVVIHLVEYEAIQVVPSPQGTRVLVTYLEESPVREFPIEAPMRYIEFLSPKKNVMIT